MHASSLVYPMYVMVLLTLVVLVRLFRSRVRAVREGVVEASYFRLFRGGAEPDYAVKAGRHFANLFEAPMLFYAACLAAMVTQTTGPAMTALAWGYVVTRLVHAYIHLGGNRLRLRIRAYFASWMVLVAMWTYLAVSISLPASLSAS